jgi:protein phosphatase
MLLKLPNYSLVLLIGASCSERSSFARKFFTEDEIISLGITDDELKKEETSIDNFKNAKEKVAARLKEKKFTVIDAPNIEKSKRKVWLNLAEEYFFTTVGVVFQASKQDCSQNTSSNNIRAKSNNETLRSSFKNLKKEFDRTIRFQTEGEIEQIEEIIKIPSKTIKSEDNGPFDIIGDIHGCFEELKMLLEKLQYNVSLINNGGCWYSVDHPQKRRVIFLGDLVDRGPASPEVLRLVMSMVNSGVALCVPGNHDDKLMRKLQGKNVQIKHGLEVTMNQFAKESEEFAHAVRDFLFNLPSHFVLDDGKLVVAHAGLKENMQGHTTETVRDFCLYGETTGETDEYGIPIRGEWWKEYGGKPLVVYGHSPVLKPEFINNTIDIDTGCVFGGYLTALKYPEKEFVSVSAKQIYSYSARPEIFDSLRKEKTTTA